MQDSSKRRGYLKTILGLTLLVQLTACVSHYPINNPIESIEPVQRLLLDEKPDNRSDELLLILTFSGGGTRAAAFAFGVLQTLADTQIVVNGQKRRLLDEVDAISSVSGGSFTAAYYGLFKDRIFEDFETKFLKRNVQSELTKRVFSPRNWPKLASLHYERSDLAAEYYDELLFENKTFRDFITANSPVIAINATNIALRSQFTFIGAEFVPICADLLSYPVSRAVTASSAVPGAFTSIILKNYAGTCGYQLPGWATEVLDQRQVNTRRYHLAKILSEYQDIEAHPYIHLLDGGISDNLGIRVIINLTYTAGGIWNKLQKLDLTKTSKLAIIAVNAQKAVDTSFTKRDFSIPIFDTLGAVSSIPLDQYSFETMEFLRYNMSRWRETITAGRCGQARPVAGVKKRDTQGATPACAAQTYLIEVDFARLQDESERHHLKHLPTSFHLEPGDVDRLKAAAQKILADSVEFKTLVDDMRF
jgi:NTE family protein